MAPPGWPSMWTLWGMPGWRSWWLSPFSAGAVRWSLCSLITHLGSAFLRVNHFCPLYPHFTLLLTITQLRASRVLQIRQLKLPRLSDSLKVTQLGARSWREPNLFFLLCFVSKIGGIKISCSLQSECDFKSPTFSFSSICSTLTAKQTILAGVGGQNWGPLFLLLGTSGCCLTGIYLHTVLKDISVFSLATAKRKHLYIVPLQLWVLLWFPLLNLF